VPTDEAKELTSLVTPRLLRRQAGERFFDRGETYFAEGAVRSLRPSNGSVAAVVQGTRRYRVRLWVEDGELDHDCTCPVGRDGAFCKHCVAVGLAWHAGGGGGKDNVDAEDAGAAFGDADLRAYLLGLSKEELAALLFEQADEDERLHRRLTLRAAQTIPGTADVSVWKDAFDEAVGTEEYVHYREAYDYACGIEEVIESLEDFLRNGRAEKVIGLTPASRQNQCPPSSESREWVSSFLIIA